VQTHISQDLQIFWRKEGKMSEEINFEEWEEITEEEYRKLKNFEKGLFADDTGYHYFRKGKAGKGGEDE
jgi:hypothetical protein